MFPRNYFVGSLALIMFIVIGYLSVRVSTTVRHGTLDEVQRMEVFAPSPPRIPCTWLVQHSPHRVNVSVMTKIESRERLLEFFPFLRYETGKPSADSFCSHIPERLMKTPESKTAFTATDPYWLLLGDDRSASRSYDIRAAYSEQTGYFYLEYGWDT